MIKNIMERDYDAELKDEKLFLTDDDYFSDTTHISNSMVSAYLRSPSYFKALYIDKSIVRPITAALEFGSAVDCILTEGTAAFNKLYSVAVYKKDNPKLFEENKTSGKTILTQATWDKVIQVTNTVMSTEAHAWLLAKNALPQIVLTGTLTPLDSNQGVPIKGKLDWLTIIDDTAYIDDLKTTQNILPMKYHYHALDYGYYRQAWMYKQLVLQNYPQVKFVHNRHLAVTKTDWPEVATFTLNETYVDFQEDRVLRALHGITNKDFNDPVVSWDNSLYIGEVKEEKPVEGFIA